MSRVRLYRARFPLPLPPTSSYLPPPLEYDISGMLGIDEPAIIYCQPASAVPHLVKGSPKEMRSTHPQKGSRDEGDRRARDRVICMQVWSRGKELRRASKTKLSTSRDTKKSSHQSHIHRYLHTYILDNLLRSTRPARGGHKQGDGPR